MPAAFNWLCDCFRMKFQSPDQPQTFCPFLTGHHFVSDSAIQWLDAQCKYWCPTCTTTGWLRMWCGWEIGDPHHVPSSISPLYASRSLLNVRGPLHLKLLLMPDSSRVYMTAPEGWGVCRVTTQTLQLTLWTTTQGTFIKVGSTTFYWCFHCESWARLISNSPPFHLIFLRWCGKQYTFVWWKSQKRLRWLALTQNLKALFPMKEML